MLYEKNKKMYNLDSTHLQKLEDLQLIQGIQISILLYITHEDIPVEEDLVFCIPGVVLEHLFEIYRVISLHESGILQSRLSSYY